MCCSDGGCKCVYLVKNSPYLNLVSSSETLKESISKDSDLVNLFLRYQVLCLINNLGQILFLLCVSLKSFATFPHQFTESKS